MTKDQGINILKHGLLAFVLLSVGFAIGKEMVLRQTETPSEDRRSDSSKTKNQVVVSYVHATIRCVSCNTIERLVKETLDEQFANAISEETITVAEINFQKDMDFARQYEIVANCVVLHRMVQGNEVAYQRLDKVWKLYEDPTAFKQYLGHAIQSYLDLLPGSDV